jgi:U3 small nucleolar RNA-associated protein 25
VNPGKGKGIGAAKGVHMRLFSDFFISDIIIASPIGLKLVMEQSMSSTNDEEETTASRKIREANASFLSSIEIIALHQADVLFMQNWDHVEFVLQHCNKLPKDIGDTDFSRVRPYFLDGNADMHRQLIISSQFNDPELASTFRRYSKSISGNIRLKKDWNDGTINQVVNSVTQVFQLIPRISSFMEEDDLRFSYFKEFVLSPILRNKQSHTLIVTPSYLNYVRVRNELMRSEVRWVGMIVCVCVCMDGMCSLCLHNIIFYE